MASVVFFLRSTIKNKPSSVWIRFKDKDIDISLSMKQLRCSVDEWKNGKCKNANKKMFETDLESINGKLLKIESYVLQEYSNHQSVSDLKIWLRLCVDNILSPRIKSVYSSNLIDFIDTYLELRQNSITKRTNYKIKVLKSMLIDFCHFNNKPSVIMFKEMDNYFKDSFEKYCLNINYKHDTIYSKLKDAKAISKFAENYDIEPIRTPKNGNLGLQNL